MQNLSRIPITIAAIVSGVCALIGLLIFSHTYSNTPTVQEIPIYLSRHSLPQPESKASHILQPEITLIFFFLWMSYYAVTWKRFMLKGSKIHEKYVQRFPSMSRLNVQFLVIAISLFISAFSVFHLWDLINRSNDVWKLV
jgi:hypothetical protein